MSGDLTGLCLYIARVPYFHHKLKLHFSVSEPNLCEYFVSIPGPKSPLTKVPFLDQTNTIKILICPNRQSSNFEQNKSCLKWIWCEL